MGVNLTCDGAGCSDPYSDRGGKPGLPGPAPFPAWDGAGLWKGTKTVKPCTHILVHITWYVPQLRPNGDGPECR